MSMSKLDYPQVIKSSYSDSEEALKVINVSSLIPKQYDKIELSYTGDDLTGVVYKLDGSTVVTLTLAYTGGKLTSVTKT